jgi:tRNA(Arg) A34 adenosine deaminase TadA
MDIIRFSILLSMLLFGVYANHTAERDVTERRLNNLRFDRLREEIAEENYAFIHRVLEVHKSVTEGNERGLSASLIVKDGNVAGTGSDRSKFLNDPSAHATVIAVREASKNIGMENLKGAIVYSTAELCPMCLSLLYVAEIKQIVYCVPSEGGLSAEVLTSDEIYGALRQNLGKRPIPEILFPYKKADGAVQSATGNASQ